MDGITAAKEVLKNNNIPVIFMTGHMGQKYSSKINIGSKHAYNQTILQRIIEAISS